MPSKPYGHVAYLKKFADMQVPVIPGTVSFIDPTTKKTRKGGKTPGIFRAPVWLPIKWRELGTAVLKQAQLWDAMNAGVGLRLGIRGYHSLDVDITDAGLARTIREFLITKIPMIRRVDHPDHHKFLCFFQLVDFSTGEAINLHKLILTFIQPDGIEGKIELLGVGQYCNVEGIHPDRLTPYVWNTHPVDTPVSVLYREDWQDLLLELRDILALGGATNPRIGSTSTGTRTPEISQNRVSEADLPVLLGMIANDERFRDRKAWMAIFHAIWVATDGLPYGREAWQDWCFTIKQQQPDEPGRVWDAGAVDANSPGLSALLSWAQQTAKPGEFAAFQNRAAQAVFSEKTEADEPGFVDDLLARLEREWVYVLGEQKFYHVPSNIFVSPLGWTAALGNLVPLIRLAWGARAGKAENKQAKGSMLTLFRQHHPDRYAHKVADAPGEPLLFERYGARCLNMWRPLPRPHKDQPLTQSVLDRYFEHCVFVLGSEEAAELWLKWNAFLLQHPAEQPGWHWLLMGGQGLGKDQMAKPFMRVHKRNDGAKQLLASSLKSNFNEYATKRFVVVSELKQMSGARDAYNELKAVASQSGDITINPKGRPEYTAANVVAFVMFSNEPVPMYIPEDDRRFYVLDSLKTKRRDPAYYVAFNAMVLQHADEIAEHCYRMELTAADYALLRGHPPITRAKIKLIDATMPALDQALIGIREDLASGVGISYRPVFTASEITSWIRDGGTLLPTAPRYPALYAVGFRPVTPVKGNPEKAGAYKSKKLWRVSLWKDARGQIWNLDTMSIKQLYRSYMTGKFTLAIVDDDDNEADEADKI